MDWIAFTPGTALLGGLLIGAATGLYLLGAARIAGIAGIVAAPWRHLVTGRWRSVDVSHVAFAGGLLLAPWIWKAVAPLPVGGMDVGRGGLLLAGLLVGFGVRMANGCTSGHGVCGLSRFSPRSLVNVLVFMGVGALTVWVVRHAL